MTKKYNDENNSNGADIITAVFVLVIGFLLIMEIN
jgi:hypothetical protein